MNYLDEQALVTEHGSLAERLFDGPPLTGADRRRLRRVRGRLDRTKSARQLSHDLSQGWDDVPDGHCEEAVRRLASLPEAVEADGDFPEPFV